MAGKTNNNNTAGRGGGRGGAGRGGGGRGRTYTNNNKPATKKVGLCKDLEANIFDFGTKTAADLMRTTQEKIVQYVGAKFGGDIANELQNRSTVVIPLPTYPTTALSRHSTREVLVRAQQNNLLRAHRSKKAAIEASIVAAPADTDLPIKLAEVENEIAQLEFDISEDLEVQMSEQEKNDYRLNGKTYTDRVNKLKTHREQVYALILGQCTQLLQDKMKQDSSWSAVSKSYDPLDLYSLIEKVIIKKLTTSILFWQYMNSYWPYSATNKATSLMHNGTKDSIPDTRSPNQ